MQLDVKTKAVFYGIMVYWKQVPDAARYTVKLYTADEGWEIATVEIDRNTCYHSFQGLGYQSYKIKVQAENRAGELIAESNFVDRQPTLFRVGR